MADSLTPSPQNPVLGALARALQFREQAQSGLNSPTGSLLDLLLPTSRTVERWSYGDPVMRMPPPGTGGYIPVPTRDREYLAESVAYAPLGTAAKLVGSGVPLTAGVIKPKGGNWLAGQVEKQIEPLKTSDLVNTVRYYHGPGFEKAARERIESLRGVPGSERIVQRLEDYLQNQHSTDATLNRWLDQKLTKYIKNEMATPEDPLRLQADAWAEKQTQLLAEKDSQIAKARARQEAARTARGANPEDMTRSDAQIRALQRERDEIAARRGLHYRPPDLNHLPIQQTRMVRGFPEKATASSEMGQSWENLADRYLGYGSSAGEVIEPNYYLRGTDAKRIYAENPWLFKVPPETRVNMINTGLTQQNTGFAHMVDELQNALAKESDLPTSLRITPEKLDKMTVAQVAELVDRIDAHRAVNRSEAMLEDTLKADLFKEYPSEQGSMRWVQLNREGQFKAESDAMGHSVRGYEPPELGGSPSYGLGGWDAIKSGEAKVYSLRDPRGQPLATIEVKLGRTGDDRDDLDDLFSFLNQREMNKVNAFMDSDDFDPRAAYDSVLGFVKSSFPAKAEKFLKSLADVPPIINQIKGPNNAKPDEAALPYIHDFIKSQKWSEVKDLQNTDLMKYKGDYVSPADLEYLTEDKKWVNLADFAKQYFADNPTQQRNFIRGAESMPEGYLRPVQGMAAGGLVMAQGGPVEYDADVINELADRILSGNYAAGGAVAAPLEYDEGKIQALADKLREELYG